MLNCVAHGFYMGARKLESRVTPSFWVSIFGLSYPITDERLWKESVKAATYYIKKKGYATLGTAEIALIRATLSYGFRAGYEWRQK